MGADLVGKQYIPLFELPVNFGGKTGYRVVSDDYVSLEDGTGVVHIAPAFGEDDARVGKRWELPFLQLVNASGHMVGGTPWDGLFVKDADKPILEALKSSGKLFAALPFEHSYPFCWRCDTPLIYYARESWFIKMTAVKEKLIAFNRSVNWIPETIKEGRMGNFPKTSRLERLPRALLAHPLPVWMCECGHVHSSAPARTHEDGKNVPADLELHKPYIDEITLPCPSAERP